MFEGPVTGPEVLDNGEVTDGTHVTTGPRSDALRASNRPGGEHGSLRQQRSRHPLPGRPGHRRAGVEAGQQRTGAGNRAPGHGSRPGHHRRTGGRARQQHRCAAELADHGSLQQGRPVGLRRAGGRGGHEENPRQRGPALDAARRQGGRQRAGRPALHGGRVGHATGGR